MIGWIFAADICRDVPMQIRVTQGLRVELLEPDDFKRFDVRVELPLESLESVRTALADVAELEGTDAAWVPADWIARVADRSDDQWHNGFRKMTEYAQQRGWTRGAPLRLRAHIVWSAP